MRSTAGAADASFRSLPDGLSVVSLRIFFHARPVADRFSSMRAGFPIRRRKLSFGLDHIMRSQSQWANWLAGAVCIGVLSIYTFLLLTKPWTLNSFFAHDDALYVGVARAILQGEWLGEYNDRILAKPPGFSFFIALSGASGLPFNVSVALFNAVAASVFAGSVLRLTGSRLTAAAVLALTLLSPQYFLLGRVLRETIYPAQLLLFLGLVVFWMTSKGTLRWMLPSGFVLGWIWITREDGIWLVPGIVFCFLLAPRPVVARLKAAAACLTMTTAVVVSLGLANHSVYGRWATAEIKDATFVGMISTTQSVQDGGFLQGIAVPKAARERLYEVSPAFRTLKPVIESPEYFDFACKIASDRCGEVGNGWWHWAVRYAAWQVGYHQTPQKADEFYSQVRSDIEAACADGRLTCAWRPVAALPTMSLDDVWRVPSYAMQIARSFLLIDRPVVSWAESAGEATGLSLFYQTLNGPPSFAATNLSGPALQQAARYAETGTARFMQIVLDLYRIVFLVLAVSAVLALALHATRPTVPRFDSVQRVILILVVFVAGRVALLSLVGVTSFTTNNAVYIGPVYHLVAVVLALLLFSSVRHWRRASSVERV